MSDRLEAIKLRAEYAPAAEPAAGQEDLFWLIGEVERMRAQVIAMTNHVRLITNTHEQYVASCSTGECGA